MSRLDTEHTESNLLNVEVDMTPTFALTPYCHYCYEEKCNTDLDNTYAIKSHYIFECNQRNQRNQRNPLQI